MTEQLHLLDVPTTRDEEVERLRRMNERLQNELARAAHWKEPGRKHKHLPPPAPLDYYAWLEHVDGCPTCGRAREDLAAQRRGDLDEDAEIVVACPQGLRMMPLQELVRAEGGGGWDRREAALMLDRLLAHARRLEGRAPGPDPHIGVAWKGGRVDGGDT